MMLLKTKGIIWSYIGLIWPYWKSLELNCFTNIYLNECISIALLLLLEKRIVNRSFSFRNPKESWLSPFVMIVEISTEHRALNHIPFIYLIFLDLHINVIFVHYTCWSMPVGFVIKYLRNQEYRSLWVGFMLLFLLIGKSKNTRSLWVCSPLQTLSAFCCHTVYYEHTPHDLKTENIFLSREKNSFS